MIRLTTLGTTDLRNESGAVADSVIRQPRRFALLVWLALESRRGFVRRDRALATFWPEVTTEQGRRSLSQALHYLRQALGASAIQARGNDEIRVDLERVRTDACAFLDAADDDAPDAALRLYGGEFLPGFFCSGVPDFELWLDLARTGLRRTASDCAWAAAERACEEREWVSAAAHARRAADLAGGDEPAARRLMGFLAGIGDRAGALEAYDTLAQRLQHEYEAQPSEPTRRLAGEIRDLPQATSPDLELAIPARPATADAPAQAPSTAASATAASATAASATAASGQRRGWARLQRHGQRVRSLLVTAVLMAGFIGLWGLGGRDGGGAGGEAALTQANLVVEEASGTQGPAPALTAELIRQLAGVPTLHVLVDGTALSPRVPGVPLALRTVYAGSPDSLQATVALIDRASGRTVAGESFDGALRSPRQIAALAARITAFARQGVRDELERRRAELAGVEPEVIADYVRARQKSVLADSLIAAGVTEVARAQLTSADSQFAAIERRADGWIVPPLARAEVAYALLWAHLFEPGGEAAGRSALRAGIGHAERAIALDHEDARGHELRGLLRYFLWATTPADSAQAAAPLLRLARADLERATSLSREASRAWNYLSVILFEAGDFARAYDAGRNAIQADEFMRNTFPNRVRLFWSALEVDDMEGARQWCRGIDQLAPHSFEGEHCRLVLAAWAPDRFPLKDAEIAALKQAALEDPAARPARLDAIHAVILAHAGRTAEARTLLLGVEQHAAGDPELQVDIAWVYNALGEHERARRILAEYIAGNPLRQGIARSARFIAAVAAPAPGAATLASAPR